MIKNSIEKGQVILVILLVMAVGLTVGLSVASRSITDVQLSTQVEESSRAFSAAEAGIEKALETGLINAVDIPSSPIGSAPDKANYLVGVTSVVADASNQYTLKTETLQGDIATIWFVRHEASGSDLDDPNRYRANYIDICWGWPASATEPAIEVSVFFQAGTGPDPKPIKVLREGYDRLGRAPGFTAVGVQNGVCTISGYPNTNRVRVDFGALASASGISFVNALVERLTALRIRPIFADSKIAVIQAGAPLGVLPEQGKQIISTGQTDSGVTRRWRIEQHYPAAHDIFDFAVWSGSDLIK